MSHEEISERIIENNQDVKIDIIPRHSKKKLLDGKRANHVSFYVDNSDYIEDNKHNRIVCVSCTDQFFNIFFKDAKDENDEIMEEIFKSKVYMNYFPEEQVYRCPKCGKIEILRDPQIQDQPLKRLVGAGMENYPEYVSYMDPDSMRGDFILTANSGKKLSKRSKDPFFKDESEDELWDRFVNSKRS